VNRGYGKKCFHYIIQDVLERNGNILTTFTREDRSRAVKFLEQRDFKLVLKEAASGIEVADLNKAKIQRKITNSGLSGIKVFSVDELMLSDSNWKHKLWTLYSAVINDVPSEDEPTNRTLESFAKQTLKAPGFDPAAYFIAVDRDKYVGLSSLWIPESTPGILWTHLTGVLRQYRKQGIATVLKYHTLNYAVLAEAKYIETDNEENNPMYQINLKLGFKPLPAWLTYQLKLS
jgi:GNAT superfamily N-acetyltransferase